MPVADINGQQLYYEDSGGPGAPVIFSHGFLMDHEMFAPQVEELSDEFRCITWDERGFGASRAAGPFNYYDSAADCVAILDHLGIDGAVLGGMSQGGFLSLRAALTSPDRVKALVLIDTEAGVENQETIPAYDAMSDEWMANGPANVQDAIAGLILGGGVDPAPWFAKWAELPRDGFRLAYRCLIERDDITARLPEITCPAIVFHGDADQAIGMERAEALRDGLGNCEELVVVKGAAHAANLSHPDQVNPRLREFLRKHA
ncbi:MAG TPA: alpha/beta hydrolase [Acidimicrobiales bacterium]|nr:alpha/beta hydrolase [Acidimicrobiales bacterium]